MDLIKIRKLPKIYRPGMMLWYYECMIKICNDLLNVFSTKIIHKSLHFKLLSLKRGKSIFVYTRTHT